MAQQDRELTVAQRLGQLLDRGLLPAGGPAEAAERLIDRLERPARVALLGLPGSGKSAVLNLLCGSMIVPDNLRLPTIIVQHRSEERMLCTLADGRTETVPGRDLSRVLALNPALVTVEMDLPALKVISLLEVSAGPMDSEQRRAALWASKRADILIWCSTSYLPKEQQVWEEMPDAVKDNAFLFLTKTDLLGSREAARVMLDRVEQRAGDEFRQVLPLSARQARAALQAQGGVNTELFRDSGAGAVIGAIKNRVQMARRADTDMAELLLARHQETAGFVARRFAEPEEPAVTLNGPDPEWRPPPEPVADPVPEPDAAQAPDGKAESQPPLRLVTPAPDPVDQPEPLMVLTRAAEPGRRRFADRIKSMPPPDEAAAASPMPLRSTWKSKSETAAPEVAPPAPTPPAPAQPQSQGREPAEASTRPAADRVPAAPPAEEAVDARIAAMIAASAPPPSASPPPPAPPPPAPTPPAALTPPPAASAPAAEPADREERPMPTNAAPLAERSARTSLFGARLAASAEPAPAPAVAPTASPPARTVPGQRPGEPVVRVRAAEVRPTEPPRPAAPPPEVLASPRLVPGPDRRPAETDASGAALRRERPRIAARAVAPAPDAGTAAGPRRLDSSADLEIVETALTTLATRSASLAAEVKEAEKPPVDLILDHARRTTELVMGQLARATSPDVGRISGDLGEVLDLVMLMQLEKGHAPADDALTLLLQIRRDLETLRLV